MDFIELIWAVTGARTELLRLRNELAVVRVREINLKSNLTRKSNQVDKLKQDILGKDREIEALLESFNNCYIIPVLPQVFTKTNKVYKGGFHTWTKEKNGHKSYYLAPEKGGSHLCLTSYLEKVIKQAKLKGNETALTCFNKILKAVQKNYSYSYDKNQWGERHAENWTPPELVLATKKDDCESLAGVVISTFEYYKLTRSMYYEAYAFIGTGLFSQKFGHGFPCLYLKDVNDFEKALYIGEATLSKERDAKQLKDCKNVYWCDWGNNSFWHDFKINEDLEWWDSTTAVAIRSERMTGEQVKERHVVKSKKEFGKKKREINKFWK